MDSYFLETRLGVGGDEEYYVLYRDVKLEAEKINSFYLNLNATKLETQVSASLNYGDWHLSKEQIYSSPQLTKESLLVFSNRNTRLKSKKMPLPF